MLPRKLQQGWAGKPTLDRPLALSPFALAAGQRKLGVHQPQAPLTALVNLLENVHGLDAEVHRLGMAEAVEEGHQLVLAFARHNLHAYALRLPLLVDGHHHAPPRDVEPARHAVELDDEACNGRLEVVEV